MRFSRALATVGAAGAASIVLAAPALADWNTPTSGAISGTSLTSSLCSPTTVAGSISPNALSLSTVNFSCAGITIPSPWSGPLSTATLAGSAAKVTLGVSVNVATPSCTYAGSVVGHLFNVSGGVELRFINASISKTSGGFLCPSPYTLNHTFLLNRTAGTPVLSVSYP
ncbi:hypothetical protein EDD29_4100 [Actinocorallia herbida]|uniref:Uncharacterized protein n=1 Tax=Actinocorallia herbida TaxID=58109 RepID=A0A3N1CZ22_9ACTN|nr:hypothetical protein [Actinocorallia herbida]ROO86527.1 hypothetical protein EDD29_4100 [Actinocorallia herbida]